MLCKENLLDCEVHVAFMNEKGFFFFLTTQNTFNHFSESPMD